MRILRDLNNGRLFSHALVVLQVTSHRFPGYCLARGDSFPGLAFGTFTHLLFNCMWNEPRTLFWPLLGRRFPSAGTGSNPFSMSY